MEYYLIPINETQVYFLGERLKDLLYEKYPSIGLAEVTKTTKVLGNIDKDEKKNKIETKSDKKIDKLLDKLNIPKYIICQKHSDETFSEVDTGLPINFKSKEKLNKFKMDFQLCYEYYFATNYAEKIVNFINKESELEKAEEKIEEKEQVKTKKKTKKEDKKK